jgi:hypothetical protein
MIIAIVACFMYLNVLISMRIILKWINRMRSYGLDSSGSRWGLLVGSCEHGNEPLGSVKCRDNS